MFEQQDFQPLANDTQSASEPLRESLRESLHELRESSPNPDFAQLPKSSSELAAHFSCTKEAIQDWFKIISQAYCWLPLSDLKSGVGKNTRYSAFCIQQMFNLKSSRESGQTANEWIASIHQENAEAITNWKASQEDEQKEVEILTDDELKATSDLIKITADSTPFSGLAIQTKATERVESLAIELKQTDAEAEADFAAFMELTAEIITQDEAAELADDLEFQKLRQKNATKWLKRKAILESDKQKILQGNIANPKQTGNSPAAVS